MGYSLTGAMNRPSVPAGSGLEVDKLSSKYVQQYFTGTWIRCRRISAI